MTTFEDRYQSERRVCGETDTPAWRLVDRQSGLAVIPWTEVPGAFAAAMRLARLMWASGVESVRLDRLDADLSEMARTHTMGGEKTQ